MDEYDINKKCGYCDYITLTRKGDENYIYEASIGSEDFIMTFQRESWRITKRGKSFQKYLFLKTKIIVAWYIRVYITMYQKFWPLIYREKGIWSSKQKPTISRDG